MYRNTRITPWFSVLHRVSYLKDAKARDIGDQLGIFPVDQLANGLDMGGRIRISTAQLLEIQERTRGISNVLHS